MSDHITSATVAQSPGVEGGFKDIDGVPVAVGDVVADTVHADRGGVVVAFAGNHLLYRMQAGSGASQDAALVRVLAKRDGQPSDKWDGSCRDVDGKLIRLGDIAFGVEGYSYGGTVIVAMGNYVMFREPSGRVDCCPANELRVAWNDPDTVACLHVTGNETRGPFPAALKFRPVGSFDGTCIGADGKSIRPGDVVESVSQGRHGTAKVLIAVEKCVVYEDDDGLRSWIPASECKVVSSPDAGAALSTTISTEEGAQ